MSSPSSAPSGPAGGFLADDPPVAIAHRGGADEHPENTMAAFEHAVGLGYRYVETDVRLTRDGVLLAFHDDRLGRVTDRRGRIADLDWDDVADARIAGLHPVPRFDELLAAWPDLRVAVDPKDDRALRPLLDAVQRAGAIDRVCVGAFSDGRIAEARRRLGPRLATGLGPRAVARLKGASRGVPGGSIAGAVAQVPERLVDAPFVDEAHRRGLHVHVWTINDPTTMHGLLDLGVDGIMTDRPTTLLDVFAERAGANEAEVPLSSRPARSD